MPTSIASGHHAGLTVSLKPGNQSIRIVKVCMREIKQRVLEDASSIDSIFPFECSLLIIYRGFGWIHVLKMETIAALYTVRFCQVLRLRRGDRLSPRSAKLYRPSSAQAMETGPFRWRFFSNSNTLQVNFQRSPVGNLQVLYPSTTEVCQSFASATE